MDDWAKVRQTTSTGNGMEVVFFPQDQFPEAECLPVASHTRRRPLRACSFADVCNSGRANTKTGRPPRGDDASVDLVAHGAGCGPGVRVRWLRVDAQRKESIPSPYVDPWIVCVGRAEMRRNLEAFQGLQPGGRFALRDIHAHHSLAMVNRQLVTGAGQR